MPESTLVMARDDLREVIADTLGYGTLEAVEADAEKLRIVERLTKDAQRLVYKSPPVPGVDPGGYDWTWLHPLATLTLASGASEIDLPADFHGFEGDVTATSASGGRVPRLTVVQDDVVRDMLNAGNGATGSPRCIAQLWNKETTVSRGQRMKLLVAPVADQAYTLTVPYFIQPDAIDVTKPYVLGGAMHSQTFAAAGRAAAELFQFQRRGEMWAHFIEELASSIGIDRRTKPHSFGYNADRSDDVPSWDQGINLFPTVTFAGVSP